MRVIDRYRILPVVLILVGLGQLIYAVGYHTTPVLTEREAEQPAPSHQDPMPLSDPGPDGLPPGIAPPDFPDEPPVDDPVPEPPEEAVVTVAEAELRIIQEVTVGGITRLASGELKRTYSGRPPSRCPT